jgi:signal transduction histidine kinase
VACGGLLAARTPTFTGVNNRTDFDIAVLVLSEDDRARTLLAQCEHIAVRVAGSSNGAHCDAALCSDEKLRPALAAIAGEMPIIALGHDVPADASPPFVRYALSGAAALARARSALAASLDELEHQRSALLALSTLKSDLIATLAHDIKGPLTSIVGFAELMEEGFLEGADATDAARTIRTNAQRLAALANDILALSRVEHGQLEIAEDRVDLIAVVTSSVEEARADRSVDLVVEPPSAHIRGDADRLRQVFDNLLRNAIKYSPGGEDVRVEIASHGPSLVVRIIDRGIGVPPDEMSKLFQRFGRTSNARKSKIAGTGVGLFIVKTIVERHGGTVAAQSALGAGSTLTVTLPAMEAHEPLSPVRVVVITPDAQLRRFTAYELRARGFRVLELESIDGANERIRDGDVVLVDSDLGSSVRTRALLSSAQRLIGLGAVDANGWDATLGKPYLVSDLLALLPGRALTRPLSS